jgi:hypothetical protein
MQNRLLGSGISGKYVERWVQQKHLSAKQHCAFSRAKAPRTENGSAHLSTNMDAPSIVFALTAIIVLVSVIWIQLPLFRAVRRLDERLRSYGTKGSYYADWRLHLRLRVDPKALLSDNDPPEIRELKLQVVKQRAAVRNAFPKLAAIFLGGFVLTVAAAMIQSVIKWLLQERH